MERKPIMIAETAADISAAPIHLIPGKSDVGSVQHFWHYMFGYLLPVVDYHLAHAAPARRPVLESCGPVMDAVTRECLSCLGVDFVIAERDEIAARYPGIDEAVLEHWDRFTQDPKRGQELRKRLDRVVPALKAAIPNRCGCGADAALAGRILLLERSAMPNFYAPGGPAKIPGYGRARRYLSNLGEVCVQMQARGYPVAIYEPGGHSVGCQIAVFSKVRGVVGIEGAEFANLIWAAEGTRVYLLRPPEFVIPFQQCLSECMNMPYRQDSCPGSIEPLSRYALQDYFAGMGKPTLADRIVMSFRRWTGRA